MGFVGETHHFRVHPLQKHVFLILNGHLTPQFSRFSFHHLSSPTKKHENSGSETAKAQNKQGMNKKLLKWGMGGNVNAVTMASWTCPNQRVESKWELRGAGVFFEDPAAVGCIQMRLMVQKSQTTTVWRYKSQ